MLGVEYYDFIAIENEYWNFGLFGRMYLHSTHTYIKPNNFQWLVTKWLQIYREVIVARKENCWLFQQKKITTV